MTDFSEIYNRAIFRISNYDFLTIDTNKREEILYNYLLSAQVDFKHACPINLTDADINNGRYNNTLDDEIIEILALGVAYYWVSSKALNSELLHNTLTSKDCNTYSPANLLKEVQTLRTSLKKEFNGKIKTYSFRNSDIDTLKSSEVD